MKTIIATGQSGFDIQPTQTPPEFAAVTI